MPNLSIQKDPRCPQTSQTVPVPYPQVARTPQPLPALHPGLGKLLFQFGVNRGKTPRRDIAHPGPGCCRGGGCSAGGTGDTRVMLGSCSARCPHPEGTPSGRSEPWREQGGLGWALFGVSAGLMDPLPPSVGGEAAPCQGHPQPARPGGAEESQPSAGLPVPQTPSPPLAETPQHPPQQHPPICRTPLVPHPSTSFLPGVQLPGQAPFGRGVGGGGRHSTVGPLRLHPKRREIKQNERRRKGRAGEGWRGGAGVSKLPPAICCHLGDSGAPPSSVPDGDNAGSLGGGGTRMGTALRGRIPHLSAATSGSFGGGCGSPSVGLAGCWGAFAAAEPPRCAPPPVPPMEGILGYPLCSSQNCLARCAPSSHTGGVGAATTCKPGTGLGLLHPIGVSRD